VAEGSVTKGYIAVAVFLFRVNPLPVGQAWCCSLAFFSLVSFRLHIDLEDHPASVLGFAADTAHRRSNILGVVPTRELATSAPHDRITSVVIVSGWSM